MVVNYFFNTILLLYLQKMKFYIVGTLDLRLKEDPKKATPQKIFVKKEAERMLCDGNKYRYNKYIATVVL